jgi:acetylornithine deacetylase
MDATDGFSPFCVPLAEPFIGCGMRGLVYTAKEMLARLVAFDTTSDKSNLPLIEFVQSYLATHGIDRHLVPSEDGSKASLFATIGPAGSGIGLSGHTDVVPVAGQSWDTDPFTLVERNGRLYGRGTSDMKGYLACVLAAVPEFIAARLQTPVHIVLSYDEEVGCTGVRPMIAQLGERLPKPRMVFVGEPTGMAVVDAHKGPVRWRVDITGRAAHSSMPQLGVNAIAYAGRLLGELDRMEQELRALPPNPRFRRFISRSRHACTGAPADPPFTTLQVTRIEGGTAGNIVPGACWFGWEVRALPGLDTKELERRLIGFAERYCLPEMRAVAGEADVTITRTSAVPAFAAEPSSEVVALALKLAERDETFAVSFGTEASLFHEAGTPSVVCGPGDIAQAHTANEWIAVEELDKCTEFLRRLAAWAQQ